MERVLARMSKLKKLPTSSEKDQRIFDFLNEEYSLPVIFRAKGKLHICSQLSELHAENRLPSDNDSELELFKAVNEDLCREIVKLEVENESLKDSESGIKSLRERVYSLHRNTNKKLGRRDNAISEQSERIDKQKFELDKLYKKVTQMESQLKQLNKDKERLRHKAEYWRTKSYQLKSSSEDQEIQDVWLLSAHGLQNTHVSFV